MAAKDSGIPGAENIPMGQVFVEVGKGTIAKDEKTVVVCAKGGRCEIVAEELREKGFNIEHLEGGLEAWEELN